MIGTIHAHPKVDTMKKSAVFLILTLFFLVTPVLAQPSDQIVLQGDGGELNRDGITRAAEPLLARGATVVIYFVKTGGQADFYDRLDADGYTRNRGTLVQDKNLVSIYVSLERYSEILVGDNWADELTSSDLENIRQSSLNPSLRSGQYSTALVNTVAAIEKGIANPNRYIPPSSFAFNSGAEEESSEIPSSVIVIGVIIFIVVMLYLQFRYPEYFAKNSNNDSSWGGGSHRSSGGSGRSSGGGGRSSGGGSRSGGSW